MEAREIARQPLSITICAILAGIVGVASLVAETALSQATGPQPGPGEVRPIADAWRSAASTATLFGWVVVAGYAGVVARPARRSPVSTPGVAGRSARTGSARSVAEGFAALAAVLLAGTILVIAAGSLIVAAGTIAAGQPVAIVPDRQMVAASAILALRAWWGLLVPAGAGFGAAVVTQRAAAGPGAGVVLLLGEQVAALLLPVDILRFAPLMNARVMAGATSLADVLAAFVVATVQLVVTLGVATVVAARANHPIG